MKFIFKILILNYLLNIFKGNNMGNITKKETYSRPNPKTKHKLSILSYY